MSLVSKTSSVVYPWAISLLTLMHTIGCSEVYSQLLLLLVATKENRRGRLDSGNVSWTVFQFDLFPRTSRLCVGVPRACACVWKINMTVKMFFHSVFQRTAFLAGL